MNFNFYEEYKSYSNLDLLKIIKQPANYQAEAVDAATRVLKERNVSNAEEQEASDYLQNIEEKKEFRKDKINNYKEKANDFLEPVLKPGTDVAPGKWVNMVLLLLAFQYAWTLYKTTEHVIRFFRCEGCSIDVFIIFELLTLVYVPIIFYLLYKKARWGWILLFADNLFVLLSELAQLYIYFKYQDTHGSSMLSYLLPIVIRSAFAIFLWREEIASYFNVKLHTKMKTAIVTTVFTLLLSGVLIIVT